MPGENGGEVQVGNETWVPKEYSVPGWEDQLMASIGYWISAIIGISMCVLITLGIGKAMELWRGDDGMKE